MKIFANFDTKAPLEAYKKALVEYGADKVIFVRRHRIYLTFYVTIPLVLVGTLLVAAFLLWWGYAVDVIGNIVTNVIFTVIAAIIALFTLIRVMFNYINYLLDYTIVTPRLIISYNQTGIFQRQVRTIDTDKIKAITVSGKSFLQSLFNYGSVVFLSEGDDDDYGDINLRFLKNPDLLREEVIRIIEMAKDD